MSLYLALLLWRPVAVLLPSQYPRFNFDFSFSTSAQIHHATVELLLPGRDFLLRRNCALARSLACSCIGVRTLSVHRKIPAMAHPAVALDFDQPPDVHLNFLAEIAFDAALGFDGLAQRVNLFLGQVFHLFGVIDVGFRAKRLRARLSDAIDRSKPDPDALLNRKIYSCNTCHACSLTF